MILSKYIILASVIVALYAFNGHAQTENDEFDTDVFDTTDYTSNEEQDEITSSNIVNPAIISNNNKQLELKNGVQSKIIALNKITAISTELTLKPGESKYFGNIEIKFHKCVKNLDPYAEDNLILLTVTEHKIDEDPAVLFQGWMMSSSISLSTFEHPIYEIFAKECFVE